MQRPKGQAKGKAAALQATSTDDSDALTAQLAGTGSTSSASPAKKPRGRPRKAAAAVATAGSTGNHADALAGTATASASSTTVSAKTQLPPESSKVQGSPAKKTRGRPCKVVAAAGPSEVAAAQDSLRGVPAVCKPKQTKRSKAEAAAQGVIPGSANELNGATVMASASPTAGMTDLPLRNRLERIQQLLNQAGYCHDDTWQQTVLHSPDRCQQSNNLQSSDSWQQPNNQPSPVSHQALPASLQASQSPSQQYTDSWQQPSSMQSPVSISAPSASLQTQVRTSPCQGFSNSPGAQAFRPALTEPICLLSPSPSPNPNPLHPLLLSPALAQNTPQYTALSPAMTELTELVGSAKSGLQPEACVELAQLVSSVQADLTSSLSCFEARQLPALDEEAVLHGSVPAVSVLSESEADMRWDDASCQPGLSGTASCHQSPVAHVEGLQHGKKRSR